MRGYDLPGCGASGLLNPSGISDQGLNLNEAAPALRLVAAPFMDGLRSRGAFFDGAIHLAAADTVAVANVHVADSPWVSINKMTFLA
jgi:hypothetical protein